MALIGNRYGKGRVRVMRVKRDTARHEARELTVEALLEGDFGTAYTAADNATTVSTDTVKNVVNVVAHGHLGDPAELLAQALADRFFHDYPQVETVSVKTLETKWSRLVVDGEDHPHSFLLDGNGKPTTKLFATRSSSTLKSGITGFTFLKTTESSWSNFYKDTLMTLKETDDRLASTSLLASWAWTHAPADYPEANATILDTMMKVFATTFSSSVQDSLYRMGMAALDAVPAIKTISMAAPNRHYLPLDLAPFGLGFQGTLFLPTDEPHGQIECTVGRD